MKQIFNRQLDILNYVDEEKMKVFNCYPERGYLIKIDLVIRKYYRENK